MFFDVDGDLAHEFYEEAVGGLRRIVEGLRYVPRFTYLAT
jgi:hypothetical protein